MICPKDGSPLYTIDHNQAVPQIVTLYECRVCKGVFSMPKDLLAFKKAQLAKLNFIKSWGIPLPSLQTVMLFSIMAFFSIAAFTSLFFFTQPNLQRSQASELVNHLSVTHADHYLFISFKTPIPVSSRITFTDKTTGTVTIKIVSDSPKTFHYLTTGDINIKDQITYQIILRDSNGSEARTEERELNIKK
jgi:hypothetical protein